MENFLKSKRFFYILTLICLVGFLVLPKICLADDFENIILTEIDKYLGLPEGKVEELLRSLINIFNSEWINLGGSGYSTAEQMAVPIIMRKAIRVQVLNHLLTDAPLETTWKIIKAAIDIVKIYINPSTALEKLEKLSVEKAIEEGKKQLFQNEIKVTPGVIEFKYTSRKGEEKIALFQYVIIYQPIDNKNGKILIRFYSLNFLEPPINKGSYGMAVGMYTELTDDIPPFIVDIQGLVENYQWKDNPLVRIDFPPTVPDLGIKPLTWWEKYILKPIETTIKDIDIIITKVTGRSLGLVEIWEEVKKFILKITNLSPATIVETPVTEEKEQPEQMPIESSELKPEEKTTPIEVKQIEEDLGTGGPFTLDEIQEMLDDIAERIDVISVDIAKLMGKEIISGEEENLVEEEIKKSEIEEPEEELEEMEEENVGQEVGQKLCERIPGSYPARNRAIINEVAWMGSINSANDEWIELKNISGSEINLNSWQLLNKDQKIKIIFSSGERFSANGFYLSERTNDNSVPDVKADKIYTGGLSNTDEALYLFNENCQLQDEVSANPNWPAGDNSSKRTMERKTDLTWQTGANPGGTPKNENSSGYIEYTGGGNQPQITLSYPQNNPVNQEIQAILSALNLKNTTYDMKISIEKEKVLSDIYNENENKWQSSFYYLTSVFSGTSFSGNFKLKIKDAENSFRGQADIFARVRESGKSSYLEFKGKINITASEPEQNQPPTASFTFSPQNPFIGQEILFNASSSTDDGQIVSYIWDFGDGNFTTDQATTTHSYSTPGDFTISLSVVENLGATSTPATTTITLTNPPTLELEVVINEIAWMGTKANSADEWIELYNNTDEDTDLTNWKLKSSDTEGPELILANIIPTKSFYLIERTDDKSTSEPADWTGPFGNSLGNNPNCEILSLYDQNGNLIDETTCLENGDWPTGKASPDYISMERIKSDQLGTDSQNWANNNLITRNGLDTGGNNINGTPKAENSVSKSQTEIVNLPFDEFAEITLTYLGSPYLIAGTLTIPQGKTLIIQPGVTIKFKKEYTPFSAGKVIVEGTLKALGNSDQPITFTDWEESPGSFWRGIYFTPTSLNSELNYTMIQNAGCSQLFCFSDDAIWIVKVEQSSILFKNSILENTDSYRGIWLVNSDSTIEGVTFSNFISDFNISQNSKAVFIQGGNPIIKNSTFKKNSYGIEIENGATPLIEGNYFEENEIPIDALDSYPSLSQNQFVNNSSNGILIKGNLSQNTTWKSGITYVVDYYLGVLAGATLTLEPGTIVKFRNPHPQVFYYEAYMQVVGSLIVEGTENSKIIFTSFKDDSFPSDNGDTNNDGDYSSPAPWDWREITFFPGSSGSLKWVIIRYGGDNRTNNPFTTNNPLVIQEGANVNVDNETVKIEFSSKP